MFLHFVREGEAPAEPLTANGSPGDLPVHTLTKTCVFPIDSDILIDYITNPVTSQQNSDFSRPFNFPHLQKDAVDGDQCAYIEIITVTETNWHVGLVHSDLTSFEGEKQGREGDPPPRISVEAKGKLATTWASVKSSN